MTNRKYSQDQADTERKRELLESLEMYFKVFFLGEDFKED